MPQAATIKSLPRAFRMMKTCRRKGSNGARITAAPAPSPLKDVLEGRMAAGVDRHLDEMAERGAADRRNGSYRRWLMTELGEIELSVRARGAGARSRWCAPTPGARPTSTA